MDGEVAEMKQQSGWTYAYLTLKDPGEGASLQALVPRRVLGRRWLPVPLWPGLRLQVVHADDVAQAIRLILEQRATGACNLAGDPMLRATDLARIVGGVWLRRGGYAAGGRCCRRWTCTIRAC